MSAPPIKTAELPAGVVVLGHYQLGARLGEGGFGEVFEAWDTKLQRSVAIKRLKIVSAVPHSESLINEARLAASLRHAAFVNIFAIEDEGDSQSIVMELVPGVTLRRWVQGETPDETRALDIIRQVAEAMQEAHASGLIHGDLKPSNLIVEPTGRVRILDFGLASKGDPQATTSLSQSDPQGTIAYMAPERFTGGVPNAQSDIYALGVILYEMLNGRRPFETLSGLALAAAHVQSSSAQWNYPELMRPSVVKLIRAMTAREIDQRLSSMAAVDAQISALDSASDVIHTLGLERKSPWQGVKKAHRVAIGAVLATCLLGVGFWQVSPYLPSLKGTLTPFSPSQTMKSGLDALALFDRPGSLDTATKNFEAILKRDPASAAAVAGLSLVYSNRYLSDGQDEIWLQKADASAQQALKLNDQLALSHVAQGWVLNQQGKRELALIAHERALALDPANFFAWYGKVQTLQRLRRHAEAKQTAERASQQFPQERVFADEIGTINFEQGDYLAAEKSFRRSIQMQPDAVFAYSNLAAALTRQSRNDDALQVLQQGLQVRPSARLYGSLGNVLFQRGDYVGAAAAFEHAVSPTKGNPANYLGWANFADTLLWIPGRTEQAQTAYEKARQLLAPQLDRAPNDATLVSRMGVYSARVGDKVSAERLMARALKLASDNPSVRFRAALAYELVGNRSAALVEITKAKALGYPETSIVGEPALLALRRDPQYPQK